jgi:hypothetical protein
MTAASTDPALWRQSATVAEFNMPRVEDELNGRAGNGQKLKIITNGLNE